MIELDNRVEYSVEIDFFQNLSNEFSSKDIELILIDSDEMKNINREQRGIDKSTDVLSFPYNDEHILGTIVICIDFVIEGAKKYNHSQNDEFALLFIHGLLHLLGFDHENDNGEMRLKEEEIILRYNLPKSLIVRNS